jgi:hypothetical protein
MEAGVAEAADGDQYNAAFGAAVGEAPGSSTQLDPDESGALSDQPPPSDEGVLKSFGVHTFQSAPQMLQSFDANQNVQPPAHLPPMALQQNAPGLSAADEQAMMSTSELQPGRDPDENRGYNQAMQDDPSMEGGPSFLQRNSEQEKVPDYPNEYPQWDPLYRSGARPKYDQHFPCRNGVNKPSQADVMYQIAPPVPWPTPLPPAEISGDMLAFCSAEFSEIMGGFPQTADTIVDMTNSWCMWQSSMTSWVGRAQELGHPEWNFRTCAGMKYFVALFLRNELGTPDARPPGFVCTKYFLQMPLLYRVEALIKDAWSGPGTRKLDNARLAAGGGGGGADKELMRKMQEYAEALFSKMRGQRDAFLDMNGAKMDETAFKQPPTGAPPPMDKPALPDSSDIDLSLLQMQVKYAMDPAVQRGANNSWYESWQVPSGPGPSEIPPTRLSFLGSLFNVGRSWAGAPPPATR